MAQRFTVKELTQAVVELSEALVELARYTREIEARLEKFENKPASEAVSDRFVLGKGTTNGLSKSNS